MSARRQCGRDLVLKGKDTSVSAQSMYVIKVTDASWLPLVMTKTTWLFVTPGWLTVLEVNVVFGLNVILVLVFVFFCLELVGFCFACGRREAIADFAGNDAPAVAVIISHSVL